MVHLKNHHEIQLDKSLQILVPLKSNVVAVMAADTGVLIVFLLAVPLQLSVSNSKQNCKFFEFECKIF